MTPSDYLVGFVAMAIAIVTILVVGTLAAADLIHIAHREPTTKTPQAEDPPQAHSVPEAFAALGSSLAAGSRLRPDAGNDGPSTAQTPELATSTSGGNSNAHR